MPSSKAEAANPPKISVFGIGNPLRTDDGVGWRAVENLRTVLAGKKSPLPENIALSFECFHQLLPEHSEQAAAAALLIIIDASCELAPGELSCAELNPARKARELFHAFEPADLIRAAENLYGRKPKALLIAVGAASFEYGEELSEEVSAALPALIEMVIEQIEEFVSRAG